MTWMNPKPIHMGLAPQNGPSKVHGPINKETYKQTNNEECVS